MKVNIKLSEEATIPAYQTIGSAGFDFHSTKRITILPRSIGMIPTGIYLEIPLGFELQIRSRSGMSYNNGIFVLNSPGTIDSDYRGEIKIILANFSDMNYTVQVNDRVAQGILAKYERADWEIKTELDETERGNGGLGSTG